MNLTLHLTPETETKLQRLIASTGKNPELLAVEALQEMLDDDLGALPASSAQAQFESWFAAHPSSNAICLDDSRDQIYEGRGE